MGNNYNQTVKAVKKNFDEQRARTLLYRFREVQSGADAGMQEDCLTNAGIQAETVAKTSRGASLYGALAYYYQKAANQAAKDGKTQRKRRPFTS